MIPHVQIVTVYTPRPGHPKWYDYMPLLRVQRDSARWFGYEHLVVTDRPLPNEFTQLRVDLPDELMPAMIAGVVARLQQPGTATHLILADADCLVARDLTDAFAYSDNFDLGLTYRSNTASPINNGAMYVPNHGIAAALKFFEYALNICGSHWGADQEAISQAAAPVPMKDDVGVRHGCRVSFLDMKRFAAVPKAYLSKHGDGTFMVHFKGETKLWMEDYARQYVFVGESNGTR